MSSTVKLRFPSTHKRKDNQMVNDAVRVEDAGSWGGDIWAKLW